MSDGRILVTTKCRPALGGDQIRGFPYRQLLARRLPREHHDLAPELLHAPRARHPKRQTELAIDRAAFLFVDCGGGRCRGFAKHRRKSAHGLAARESQPTPLGFLVRHRDEHPGLRPRDVARLESATDEWKALEPDADGGERLSLASRKAEPLAAVI